MKKIFCDFCGAAVEHDAGHKYVFSNNTAMANVIVRVNRIAYSSTSDTCASCTGKFASLFAEEVAKASSE